MSDQNSAAIVTRALTKVCRIERFRTGRLADPRKLLAPVHDERVVDSDLSPSIACGELVGMDSVAKEESRVFLLLRMYERGWAVVLTTHETTDSAQLYERVLLINRSRLKFDGGLCAKWLRTWNLRRYTSIGG